jgi:hypothetical protein
MSRSALNPRNVVALLAMVALLAGCAGPAGGGGSDSGDTGTSSDSGDSDSSESGDSGDSGDAAAPPDPCTLIPDAALETALGGALAEERTPYPQSGSKLCRIQTTADPPALLNVDLYSTGSDGFEIQRGYKDDLADLYQELPGIGDDAFAFGHEVTVLKGTYFVIIFMEGLPFDNVPEAERLERAKTLALAAADQLP